MAFFSCYSGLAPLDVLFHKQGFHRWYKARASRNYCKYWSAIQRSDQKLWHFSAVIPVWCHKTSSSSGRASIGNKSKWISRIYGNCLSMINGLIKSYGAFQLLFRSGVKRPPLQRVRIPQVVEGNETPETTVNFRGRSNGRIKSQAIFQLLFRSGATRPPF